MASLGWHCLAVAIVASLLAYLGTVLTVVDSNNSMMISLRNTLLAAVLSLVPWGPAGTGAGLVDAASLQKMDSAELESNPTGVGFYLYVPDYLQPKPPILVNPHWCHGNATQAFASSTFAAMAREYGFLVIYPDSPNDADHCWDVSSAQTLSHNGGGDSLGIVSMVRWTLQHYHADPARVFVTGVSSGAMMTTTLIGAYPDLFAAGSAFSGVPFSCYAPFNNSGVYDYWNSDCAAGLVHHTGREWAANVTAAFPGYTGWRPKMQIFHGTVDETLNYTVFGEEIKQWTSVFGYGDNSQPTHTILNTPLTNWTKYVYGPHDWFEAYSAAGVPHNIPVQVNVTIDWFDLRCQGPHCFKWGQGHY